MVGPIRTLRDLRRIEAAVRITCNVCGGVRMCDREALIHQRLQQRLALEWSAVCASLPCWKAGCGSTNTWVEAVPFSADRIEVRRRRAENVLINLALRVLYAHCYKPSAKADAEAMPEVRLALRVLYPFVRDDAPLRAYWAAATAPRDHAWDSCHRPYERIVKVLLGRGLAVDGDLR